MEIVKDRLKLDELSNVPGFVRKGRTESSRDEKPVSEVTYADKAAVY